jgi:SAM-dependent methyltransferase
MHHASNKTSIGRAACCLSVLSWLWLGGGRSQAQQAGGPVVSPSQSRVAAQAPGVAEPEAKAKREDKAPDRGKKPDVIYVPTPQKVVDKMLEMAEVKKGDVLYDLGCGDGRIVVTAAKKFGLKAVGFDIDPVRIKEARQNVKENGVEHLVTIRQADIFETDLAEASVVTLYLLPELNVRLMPQLRKLKRGSRIVSHDFDMKGATPKKVVMLQDEESEEDHSVYLWVVPWAEDDRP